MSEWLLFNTKWGIFQLYHGENKLHIDEMMMSGFVIDQQAFIGASSLKKQSVGRYVAPLEHIILIPSQPVFTLTP